MTTTYANFDLLIDRGPAGYRARVLRSLAGEATTEFSLPYPPDDLADLAWPMLRVTGREGAASSDAGMATFKAYGSQLYQAAFAGPVGLCLRRSLDEAERRGIGLRLRLRLDASVLELTELPWEFLFAPDLGHFLALSDLTPIVRYVEVDRPVQPLRAQLPLNILAAVSKPSDVTPLDVEHEWRNLQDALDPLIQRGVIVLERLDTATLPALQARLRRGPVDLLHFVGHGFFDAQSNTGGLVFENDGGGPEIATAETLGMLLHDHQALRLIFLNACRGAQGGRSDPFAGVAQRLVQQGVPAILAMQFPVSDAAAIDLSQAFYQALADGLPADTALSQARKAIAARGSAWEWATPVLFSRSDDNRLIQLPAQAEETQSQRSPALQVPAPPEPMRPPDTSGFVGRERELALYQNILESAHFAIISGMPGVGKTALAARLAFQVAQDPVRIFWHQFHEGESIEAIIWQMAALLARNGQGELWQMLQLAAQSGGKPPPTQVLLDYLFQLVRGRGYVVCLDDFHHVEDDPLVESFLERLQLLLPSGEIAIILTSREVPAFVRLVTFEPLPGLDRRSVEQLLDQRQVNLPAGLIAELHRCTDGNAELVTLAAETLRRAAQPKRVIERLIDEEDVEGFLLREVDEQLQPEEKSIMSGVAVLLNYPGTRDAIETTLDTSGIRRTLRYLSNRYLLMELDGRQDREYTQHAILQAFYYDLLGRRERQAMHRRAAGYYEQDEPDRLRAALHYHRAGEPNRAAELATGDLWTTVNQGQAYQLRLLLETLEQSALDPEPQLHVLVTLGDLLAFLGAGDQAQTRYRQALAALARSSAPLEHRDWEARAHLGMGTALAHQTPEEALRWLEQGVAAAGDSHAELLAALLNRIGTIRVGLADYEAAIGDLQQALSLLPETPSQLRATVLNNLGAAYAWSGDADQSSRYTAQALELSTQLHDLYGLVATLSNIGIDKEIGGDWAGAGADYQEALRLAEELGSLGEQARIHALLGTLRLHQGDDPAAESHLLRALSVFRQVDNREYLAGTLPVLGQLHIRRQEWEPARTALAEAEALCVENAWEYILPETYTTRAQLALALGDLAQAQERAEQAIAVAVELGQAVDEGKAWRTKGMILAEARQTEEAFTAFEHSLALLLDQDPYEAANTQLAWGQVLMQRGYNEQGLALIQQARDKFSTLGVHHIPAHGRSSDSEVTPTS